MKPSIKRCTLALIMCGLSAICSAQEVLWQEDFSDFTISQDWTDREEKQVGDGWNVLFCGIQDYIYGKFVKALKIYTHTYKKIVYYGYAKTPTLNNGDFILTFNHIKTNDNASQIMVSIVGQGLFTNNKNDTTINITNNKWTSISLNITGATSESKINFSLTSDNLCYIDDIVVTKDGMTLNETSDNSSLIAAHDEENLKVKTTRTLKGGIWNTLCLPFNVTKATMEAALGQDVQLRTYTGFAGNVMTFSEVTGDDVITAGTPFLLKLNTTVTNPTFNSVTVSNSTAAQTVTRGDVSFIGTYSQKELATDGTELFITTSGGLAIPTATGNVMNGMRAYIKVPESMKFTPNGVRLAIDNETTSIQSVTTTSQPDAVYNLSGQRLQQPRKGLNIVRKNRKLIFIR